MVKRRGPRSTPLAVGKIVTGMVVGQAKRGVQVEIGATELLLPRTRYGAAADQIEASSYGTPLTVEVVADPGRPGGVGLSRTGIERSVRQARPIDGQLHRTGAGFELAPADGSARFAVVLLDCIDAEPFVGHHRAWLVGAPYRNQRFALPGDSGPG